MNKVIFSFFKGMDGKKAFLLMLFDTQYGNLLFQISAPCTQPANNNVMDTLYYEIRGGG